MVERNMLHIDGTLGVSERWSVGICFAKDPQGGLVTATQLETWLAGVESYLVSLPTTNSLRTMLGSAGKITQARAYYYPASGPAVQSSTNVFSSPIGQSSTTTKPPQCALAITLQTQVQSPAGRGRIYWPCLTGTINDSTLKVSGIGSPAQDFAAFLAAVSDAAGADGPLFPSVYSPSTDSVTPVTFVRAGDVLDTQRRRRDKLVETYNTAPVVY